MALWLNWAEQCVCDSRARTPCAWACWKKFMVVLDGCTSWSPVPCKREAVFDSVTGTRRKCPMITFIDLQSCQETLAPRLVVSRPIPVDAWLTGNIQYLTGIIQTCSFLVLLCPNGDKLTYLDIVSLWDVEVTKNILTIQIVDRWWTESSESRSLWDYNDNMTGWLGLSVRSLGLRETR